MVNKTQNFILFVDLALLSAKWFRLLEKLMLHYSKIYVASGILFTEI